MRVRRSWWAGAWIAGVAAMSVVARAADPAPGESLDDEDADELLGELEGGVDAAALRAAQERAAAEQAAAEKAALLAAAERAAAEKAAAELAAAEKVAAEKAAAEKAAADKAAAEKAAAEKAAAEKAAAEKAAAEKAAAEKAAAEKAAAEKATAEKAAAEKAAAELAAAEKAAAEKAAVEKAAAEQAASSSADEDAAAEAAAQAAAEEARRLAAEEAAAEARRLAAEEEAEEEAASRGASSYGSAPRLVLKSSPAPEFPPELRVLHGDNPVRCTATAWVDKTGKAARVAIRDCPDGLHLVALEAFYDWRWDRPSITPPAEGWATDVSTGFARKERRFYPGVTYFRSPEDLTGSATAAVWLSGGKMPKYPPQVNAGDDVCLLEITVDDKGRTERVLIDDCAPPYFYELDKAVRTWTWRWREPPAKGDTATIVTEVVFRL